MGFDYDKLKKKEDGSHWASYSDLFMVLSIVFLLLYITANLKSGAMNITRHVEFKKLQEEAKDLRAQIKVYNTLKDDYLQKEASKKEQDVYKDLMDKLDLLKEKAGNEKMDLRRKAADNEKKEKALNEYQSIIKNIIDTNMLAKKKISRRGKIIKKKRKIIAKKSQTITEQTQTIKTRNQEIVQKKKTIENNKRTIAQKESTIKDKQKIIKDKKDAIDSLNKVVDAKKRKIAKNNNQIKNIKTALRKKINDMQVAQIQYNTSKKDLSKKIKKIKEDSQNKIKNLASSNQKANRQLSNMNMQLDNVNTQLTNANKTIDDANREINEQMQVRERLSSELVTAKTKFLEDVNMIQQKHNKKMGQEKSAFMKKLNSMKLSASARSQREADYRKQVATKQQNLDKQIAQLGSQVDATSKELQNAQGKASRALASLTQEQQRNQELKKLAKELSKKNMSLADQKKIIDKRRKELEKQNTNLAEKNTKLGSQNQNLSKDLKKAKEIIEAKKKLAAKIKKNFAKAGIKAGVNGTGDVILAFGNEYFKSGGHQLTGGMESTLKKFVPTYAKSLMQDPKLRDKIESVEIVGFASPTYRGKYVDPKSLQRKDRQAVKYNMDLSYKRAKSIFNYMFNTDKLKYSHQKDIASLVKVTGKGFLDAGINSRDIASGMTKRQFCKKFDCKKAQRVIIKFTLKKE